MIENLFFKINFKLLAFAAVAIVEYDIMNNKKASYNLSEQCIVDCMPNSYGCTGLNSQKCP